ncbi:oxidoreductase NAD-binding domain-containing protein [Diaporthe helianthi]|uniref:NADH-cytochrome b5 reductase n=1 Tax=Diaporthe helianthi TaxID=158607 RepID=A0A2P5I5G3_DIAHE|nr:oxidoreductase NAD-binding domain-containing protein [Diaporthe helianthi]
MNSFRIFTQRLRPALNGTMSTQELVTAYGPTVFKGIAAAGIGGAVLSQLMRKADADSGESKKMFPRPGPSFTRLTLENSEDVNQNTKRLRFSLPDNATTGLPLTSALLTFAIPKGSYLPVLRPYTPITSADTQGHMDLLVKRYPQGKQSTHLHSLSPGDSVMFAVCIPGYKWTPNKHSSVTLIAGGAGITPIYQLVQGILDNPEDKTKVTLVFGVNSEQDVLLDDEFKKYEASHPGQFKAVYAVSGLKGESDRYRKGYVTEALLKEVAAPASEENTKVMVCGPPAMEQALLGKKGWGAGKGGGILEKLGYRKDQIHQF